MLSFVALSSDVPSTVPAVSTADASITIHRACQNMMFATSIYSTSIYSSHILAYEMLNCNFCSSYRLALKFPVVLGVFLMLQFLFY